MHSSRWVLSGLLLITLASNAAYSLPGHGNGNGKGKDKDKHHREDRDDDDRHYRYSDRDGEIRGWYGHYHDDNLPPGLAKRDRLPPGLERQLAVRGTLPPGLRKKMYRCPEDLERRLPPPPPDCRHVFIGGSLVLVNTRSFLIVDVFHF